MTSNTSEIPNSSKEAAIQILHCPFCGNAAELHDHRGGLIFSRVSFVRCESCGARGAETACQSASYAGFDDIPQLAICAWNTRVDGD